MKFHLDREKRPGPKSDWKPHITLRNLFLHNLKYILLIAVPCIVLIMILLSVQLGEIRSEEARQLERIAERASLLVNGEIEGLKTSAEILSYTKDIQSFLQKKEFPLTEKNILLLHSIQQQLKSCVCQFPFVSNIVIHFSNTDFFVFPENSYRRKEAQTHIAEKNIDVFEKEDRENGWYTEDGQWLYFYKIRFRKQVSGSILFYISGSSLSQALNQKIWNDNARLLIVDQNDQIFADSKLTAVHHSLSEIYSEKAANLNGPLKKAGFAVSQRSIRNYYLLCVDDSLLSQTWSDTFLYTVILAAIILLGFVVLLYKSTKALCKPYEVILELLKKPELLTNVEYNRRYRTIDKLGMIFTLIHQKNYQYLAVKGELSEKERMLREAQNAMLQAQINPHFLFNTLDNINWMAYELLPEDNKVSACIQQLSQLLRLSLQRSSPITSIQEEIEHAKLYLHIQKMRMDRHFSVEWNVDDQLLHCDTLCLSLQPLLENAISHGLKTRKNGRIIVSIQKQQEDVVVSVTDNGTGFSREQLDELLARMENPLTGDQKHIGLNNICQRLKLIYEDKGCMRIESIPDTRTTVCLQFPCMQTNGAACSENPDEVE